MEDHTRRPRSLGQETLEKYRNYFVRDTKHGAQFLDMLSASGAEVFRIEQDPQIGRRWWLYLKLSPEDREVFDFKLEVLVMYAEWKEMHQRILSAVGRMVKSELRVEQGVVILASLDPALKDFVKRRRGELAMIDIDLNDLDVDNRKLNERIKAVVSSIDHFDITNPVKELTGFFGRELEIETIETALDRGQSVGIFGLRKTGKTSLMNSLERRREDRGKIIIRIDLNEITRVDDFCTKIIERLWEQIREHAPRLGIELPRLRLKLFSTDMKLRVENRPDIQSNWIDDLRSLLKLLDDPIELFIDEIDQAYPERSNLESEATGLLQAIIQLRGLIQEGEQLVLLCAGVDPAMFEKPLFGNKDNLIYKLVRLVWLSPMSKDEMREMVSALARRMGIRVTKNSVFDRLFEEYGGHPLLTRKACSGASRLRPKEEIPWTLGNLQLEQSIDLKGIGSPSEQARDIVASFAEWFPEEFQVLELLFSDDPEDRELALNVLSENPEAIRHAVTYGICNADGSSRIKAATDTISG